MLTELEPDLQEAGAMLADVLNEAQRVAAPVIHIHIQNVGALYSGPITIDTLTFHVGK